MQLEEGHPIFGPTNQNMMELKFYAGTHGIAALCAKLVSQNKARAFNTIKKEK